MWPRTCTKMHRRKGPTVPWHRHSRTWQIVCQEFCLLARVLLGVVGLCKKRCLLSIKSIKLSTLCLCLSLSFFSDISMRASYCKFLQHKACQHVFNTLFFAFAHVSKLCVVSPKSDSISCITSKGYVLHIQQLSFADLVSLSCCECNGN